MTRKDRVQDPATGRWGEAGYPPTDLLRRQGWGEVAVYLEDHPAWRRADELTLDEAEIVIGRIGRVDRPAMLFDLWDGQVIDKATLTALVPGVWSGAEWPSATLSRRVWIELFRAGAYPTPSKPTDLYRGAIPSHARGMAWTRDRDKAEWFAARWTLLTDKAAHVYTVAAPPAAFLADIDLIEGGGRREGEIVVDPAFLPRLRRVPREVRPARGETGDRGPLCVPVVVATVIATRPDSGGR